MSPTTGTEMRLPDLRRLADDDLAAPCLIYFALFQLFGVVVRRTCWMKVSGFRQFRLRNLSVGVVHSMVSGCWALGFMLVRTHVMFNDPMHWYDYGASHLPMFSMGYFAHDAIDMARHELSRWSLELIAHHVVSVFVFGSAVMARKFIPYAHWALLMEVNSVFLHARSIMLMSGAAVRRPRLFAVVRAGNLFTFVVFRFLVQIWQIHWAYTHRAYMHALFIGISVLGGCFFLTMNIVLFLRVLISDGYLRPKGRCHQPRRRPKQAR